MSHLLQMRGLKLHNVAWADCSILSHLLQMRGLKLYRQIGFLLQEKSHLLQMRGLKHFCLDREHHRHSRIFYRCVD